MVPTTEVKAEKIAPSRAVPSGHKLVKLRPAPTYGPGDSPVSSHSVSQAAKTPAPRLLAKKELIVKGEVVTPALEELAERRASKRRQAFLRDATCKAICKIKHGLRQCKDQSDAPYMPDDWHKEFEPLLGDYFDFLLKRPDQFTLEPVEGGNPSQPVVTNIAGAVTVQAPAWNSWKVKKEQDWKVKSERMKREYQQHPGYAKDRQSVLEKTEAEKWAEAEPLGSAPKKLVPRGTPWTSIPKVKEQSPASDAKRSAPKEDGDWSKANTWRRNQPLCMEPLMQPLPPMRPVRDISKASPASASNASCGAERSSETVAASPEAAVGEPAAAPAAEKAQADTTEQEGDGSDDDLCFVVDVIGVDASRPVALTEVKQEKEEESVDVWSLLQKPAAGVEGHEPKRPRTE